MSEKYKQIIESNKIGDLTLEQVSKDIETKLTT